MQGMPGQQTYGEKGVAVVRGGVRSGASGPPFAVASGCRSGAVASATLVGAAATLAGVPASRAAIATSRASLVRAAIATSAALGFPPALTESASPGTALLASPPAPGAFCSALPAVRTGRPAPPAWRTSALSSTCMASERFARALMTSSGVPTTGPASNLRARSCTACTMACMAACGPAAACSRQSSRSCLSRATAR